MQYLLPDAGREEVNRALAQVVTNFKETFAQASDSIMYSYSQVGDRQKDLLDTFWEYSPYFANANTNSAQMANFLTKTVQNGAFNFDKPADFFKEVFGVKALNTDDMTDYFELRGASKKEAARQATAFTSDINSGDKRRAQGAIAALVADLASQNKADLKQSLVQLGSATAEDNAEAILKTYGVAFQNAPEEIKGTTDQLVKKQQEADPLLEYRQAQAQMKEQLQDIGGNIMQSAVPAMQEFNDLLVDNKDTIEAFGTGVATGIENVVSFYKEHSEGINTVLMGLAGISVVKGVTSLAKGAIQLKDDISSAGKWLWNKVPGAKKLGKSESSSVGGSTLSSVSSMRVTATNVHITGGIGDGTGSLSRSKNKKNSTGTTNRTKSNGSSTTVPVKSKSVTSKTTKNKGSSANLPAGYRPAGKKFWDNVSFDKKYKRDDVVELANRGKLKRQNELEKVFGNSTTKSSSWKNLFSKGSKILGKTSKGLIKGAGILGTVASVGASGYGLYQTAKDQGVREAVSSKGGSTVGSLAGGTLGGTVGSLLGPLGTAAGAAVGSWAGEKLGSWLDTSGSTRKAVDFVSNLTDSVKGLFGKGSKETSKTTGGSILSKKSTLGINVSANDQKKVKEAEGNITAVNKASKAATSSFNFAGNALKRAEGNFGTVGKASKGAASSFNTAENALIGTKNSFSTVGKVSKGTASSFKEVGAASNGITNSFTNVGTASTGAANKAKDLGATAQNSSKSIISGNAQAGQSFNGVSGSAKSAADMTRQHLMSLSSISSKGSSWGSNLITMMAAGIRSKFPILSAAVSGAASVIKNFLGFNSPTKEGPASKSDAWAGNFVTMFADGLSSDPIKERMILIAGSMKKVVEDVEGPSLNGGGIPVRSAPLLNQSPSGAKAAVTIGNIKMDFSSLAAGITDFQSFAKALTSPEGRALIRQVFGEELYKALETGG